MNDENANQGDYSDESATVLESDSDDNFQGNIGDNTNNIIHICVEDNSGLLNPLEVESVFDALRQEIL